FQLNILDNLLLLTLVIAVSSLAAYSEAYQPDCTEHINGISFADPASCSSFYVCLRGRALRRECGHGLFFDPKTQICNLPSLVECFNGDRSSSVVSGHGHGGHQSAPGGKAPCETTPKPPCNKPETPTPAPPPRPTPCTTTASSESSTTTFPPATVASKVKSSKKKVDVIPAEALVSLRDCQGLEDGTFLTNSRHCRRFYVCRNNRARTQLCPAGQWFDRELKTCRSRFEVTNCLIGRN
ncbi:hypothetical protein KR222_003290, partial [Zaprionus bogoriensis]